MIGDFGYVVAVEGISALDQLEEIEGRIATAARRAVNATLRKTRTEAKREIMRQINFRARYLDDKTQNRLRVELARGNALEGRITARTRATSLATFAKGTPGNPRFTLEVKKGQRITYKPKDGKNPRLFLMQFKNGTQGLAIRLRPGETIEGKKATVARGSTKGLTFLFGPSVNQVFRTVADDLIPGAEDYLESEFLRLMDLRNG